MARRKTLEREAEGMQQLDAFFTTSSSVAPSAVDAVNNQLSDAEVSYSRGLDACASQQDILHY